MSEWQKIETAPRDGTMVDLWAEWPRGGARLCNALWDASRPYPGWITDHRSYGVYDERQFTHWMPLPDQPTPKEPEG